MLRMTTAAALSFATLIWGSATFSQTTESAGTSTVSATRDDSLGGQVDGINQRVSILERLREVDQENDQKKAGETPVVTAGKDGFILRAPDTSYQLRIRYEGHFDARFFIPSADTALPTNFNVRRARPIIEARLPGPFFLRLLADFGNGKVEIPDAYIESAFHPAIGVRIGKFKSPFGLEVLQSTAALPFLELSLASQLAPNRDIGGQLQGEVGNGILSYAIGGFNGVTDGASLDNDWGRPKDLVGRLFTQPFVNVNVLKGFGVGVAATYGDHNDQRKWEKGAVPASVPGYKTAGQESFFKYRDTTFASGAQKRVSLQGHYYVGPFGLIGEYLQSRITVTRNGASAELINRGWYAAISYALSGEPNGYKGLKPFRAFDPLKGQWGALELAARVSGLSIDDKAFPVFADSTRAARRAIDYTGGLNWHLNRNVKLLVDYTQTTFVGGAKEGDKEDEKLIASRVQVVF